MKSVIYLLAAMTVTVAVIVVVDVQLTVYHILAVPVVVFVLLAAITTVDKYVFLSYKRRHEANDKSKPPMTAAEMKTKLAAPEPLVALSRS
jgi:Ca2+/Na+ antiporter